MTIRSIVFCCKPGSAGQIQMRLPGDKGERSKCQARSRDAAPVSSVEDSTYGGTAVMDMGRPLPGLEGSSARRAARHTDIDPEWVLRVPEFRPNQFRRFWPHRASTDRWGPSIAVVNRRGKAKDHRHGQKARDPGPATIRTQPGRDRQNWSASREAASGAPRLNRSSRIRYPSRASSTRRRPLLQGRAVPRLPRRRVAAQPDVRSVELHRRSKRFGCSRRCEPSVQSLEHNVIGAPPPTALGRFDIRSKIVAGRRLRAPRIPRRSA
jgi:hypothetical protein